ncbi:MAG: lamin tail domain-containing protein [Bacteroidetes bacterium]|nr:lamin tail domain-containing protein [Bacteroidota bacterium]
MINGVFYEDTSPPAVTGYTVCGRKSIEFTLSEEPDDKFTAADNFYMETLSDNPFTVSRKGGLSFKLEFANEFKNKNINTITIRRICDKAGNCLNDTAITFTPVWAETGDVIISEIMADPFPSVSLPTKEYLEITNRTGYSINLKNWKLSSEDQNILFPEVVLLPLERRIICLLQDTILFSKYGKVTGLKQFPSLTDVGKAVWLTDSLGTLIHGVEYSSDWYGDLLKSGGGWSLEMKDTKFPFYDEGNWIASCSRNGGSPGLINSVSSDNPDTSFYGILNVFPDDSSKIIVRFSEPVINLSNAIRDVGIDDLEVIEILPIDPLFREFAARTTSPLIRKKIYNFLVSDNIRDFAYNRIQTGNFEFGITEPSHSKDILFNELLFNPLPGDPDYVEFYNKSDKIIDASRLQIVSVNEDSGEPSQPINVSPDKRCIMPGSYYAITTDRKKIYDRYKSGDPDHLFEIANLPSMPDAVGHLILYNMELDKIDEVFYNDSLHNALLPDNEGVALAKDNPQNLSEEALSWYSESESMGWGTPGALNFNKDLEAPIIKDCVGSGKNSVEIKLSEDPKPDFLSVINFSLNDEINKPVSVINRNNFLFRITFAKELINKELNILTITQLCDKSENCRNDTTIKFTPVWAETGDIILTEIMADPAPSVSLPSGEYFEIKNRSSFSLNLNNWRLVAGEQIVALPSFIMAPGEIRILTSVQDTLLFKDFGMVTGLRQFPSLTDEGKLLCLYDSSGMLMHGVEYSDDWYASDLKSQGGWSLEIIDEAFPFFYEGNWKSSVSRKGGTPGTTNSVSAANKDNYFKGIVNLFPGDSKSLTIRFSEPVKDFTKIGSSKIEGGPVIESYSASDPLFREFVIRLSADMEIENLYKLELPETMTDFAGNSATDSEFTFGLAEPPSVGDVSFNELLFNPFPGDPDYIEFFNCSEKVIDASMLMLAGVNPLTSDTSELVQLSMTRRCILPGTYYTITTDRERLIDRYSSSSSDRIFEVPSLPSMPDDDGNILLLNNELDLIDKMSYNEAMHYSILSGFEGISLEKTIKCNPSDQAVNWHSATEISGWGTPGGPNSVISETSGEDEFLVFSSTKITPDNDGYEDLLTIIIKPGGSGNVLSVSIFDETGGLIRKVASNLLAGSEVSMVWDGTADDGTPVRSGIYIILINLFDDKGRTVRLKKVCTVLR